MIALLLYLLSTDILFLDTLLFHTEQLLYFICIKILYMSTISHTINYYQRILFGLRFARMRNIVVLLLLWYLLNYFAFLYNYKQQIDRCIKHSVFSK